VSPDTFQRSQERRSRQTGPAARRHSGRRPGVAKGALALLALVALTLAALAFVWSRPAIVADAAALAHVELPVTGGKIESVKAVALDGREIPLVVKRGRLWPQVSLAPGQAISVQVVLRRPGWIAWLAGGRTSERLVLRTPSAVPRERYVTLAAGAPLRLAFDEPVSAVAYGQSEPLRRRVLTHPLSAITLARYGEAGSIAVAAAPRRWESLPTPSLVSWFPVGAKASAVLDPRPGTDISPTTPIFLTFSRPVSAELGHTLPSIGPAAGGSWRTVDSHTIVFRPSGYGYGLDTLVGLQLPRAVRLINGPNAGSSSGASWTVPPGSSLREEQILAQLGYLPLRFHSARHVGLTPAAQVDAAVDPPAGHFSWRYGDVPPSLHELWDQQGTDNVVARGALMAFENAHEFMPEGIANRQIWEALMRAEITHERTTAGYTYVSVNEASQSLALWNDGSIRMTTPVNTGIASAPTEMGTFPVFEHIASGTMSGTNPDGSHYEDPGVPWISYFNGGDALHGFERASYGAPQSLGCVEMPPATAGEVWPYTPVGTLVHVE
jgi:hypothetical protein